MNDLQQAIYYCIYITIKPAGTNNFKKQVNKNWVHTDYRKKFKVFPVIPDINPPVTGSQAQQAPS